MKRFLVALIASLSPQLAIAAAIEPGEWEFTSVSTSRLLSGPQRASFKRCIRPEEAQNPDRWMAEPSQQGDCKVTPGKKSGDTYTWTMYCPHGNIRGAGSARLSRTSMVGETNMTGELQGQKFEIRTHVTGKRLGPCK
jgi:hypothetical protein